jgi:L-arabinonolactonase
MMHIEIVSNTRDELGECPLWDERSKSVFWIDSHKQLVRQHTPSSGDYREWHLPSAIGSIALCESGRLLVALASEFVYLDLETGLLKHILGVTHVAERIRLNDGRTDREVDTWLAPW